MKPRQRKPQKQSARLYARGNDHRDIIWYDIDRQKYVYHNALYYTEVDQDKPVRENLAWVKYPEHNLVMTYGGASNQVGAVCVMDVDRQFQYGSGFGGGARGRPYVFGLECGLTVIFSSYGGDQNFLLSEDGVIWQELNKRNIFPNGNSLYHFGEDGLCWLVPGDTVYGQDYPYRAGYTIYTWIFSKDEETEQWDVELNTYSFPDKVNDLQFICNTKQGCIFFTTYGAPYDQSGTSGANNPTYWHIDHAGVKTEKNYKIWQTNPIWSMLLYTTNTGNFAYAKVGNRCFCIASVSNPISRYSGDRYERVYLLCSQDQGATWEGETVFEVFRQAYTTELQARLNIVVRDGEVFAMFATNKVDNWKVHMFSTYTGTQWDEIELPSWVDLPVINDGGACVSQTPSKDVLRIAIDPNNAGSYDIRLADMLGDVKFDSNLRSGNIIFKDGEMLKITDDTFWFCFGSPSSGGWCAFFDNRYLAASSRAFAWQGAYIRNTDNIPDTVQPNDYCMRGE